MNTTEKMTTPETDAFVSALNDEWDVEFAALTTHAKNLERERDMAREKIAELLRCHHDEPCTVIVLKQDVEIKQLRKERDEAMEQIKGWELKWKCAVEMAALAQNKLEAAK